MTQQEYKAFAEQYVAEQIKILNHTHSFILPEFNTFSFSNQGINDGIISEFKSQFQKIAGERIKHRVLYYFKITNEAKGTEVARLISELKSGPGKLTCALPRVNKQLNEDNRILYVGKTDKDFHSRFTQHLGLGSLSTYALHLSRWSDRLSLNVELNFSICDKPSEFSLEHIESVLHYSLKPILGRSGR